MSSYKGVGYKKHDKVKYKNKTYEATENPLELNIKAMTSLGLGADITSEQIIKMLKEISTYSYVTYNEPTYTGVEIVPQEKPTNPKYPKAIQ